MTNLFSSIASDFGRTVGPGEACADGKFIPGNSNMGMNSKMVPEEME
jgi:hypothetical protein